MSGTLIASAVAALGLGAILKCYLMHGWARYYANPTSVIFPEGLPGLRDGLVIEWGTGTNEHCR
jgi:hypothetical protein